jgi:hypothetical protein
MLRTILAATILILAQARLAAQPTGPVAPVPTPSPDVIRVIELRQANYLESAVGEIDRIGAVRTGVGDLFADAAMTRKIGETHLTCANTAVDRNGRVVAQICNGVFRLDDGMIFWQSMVTLEDRAQRRINYVVNGGTGAYIGARGYGLNRFHERPTYQHLFLLSLAR